ncbi:MAG: TonB-dependent receptor [Flavobacteriaceae bacterium]|nr:TonB-dependent receptor [Bacteroidia bacterium]MBT8288572.1 TonB-dependent receptor [Bacteroidia bacterium]NNF76133.1 TonB-dependent receptor [Flavobacteriaceae bacterium]
MVNRLTCLMMVLCMITISHTNAQEKTKDSIDTQVVNVVKPYTPKISDAFKVKETPSISDETTMTKKTVIYNIFSIPVASTFTPAKGKAADVEKAQKENLYDNFLSFGAGSYTTLLGELYLNHAINRTESVGGYVSHHSSQGGIDGVILDDKFSNSKIMANYNRKLRDYSWTVDAGYQHQVYNWYGVPQPLFTEESLTDIDPQHKFFTFEFGGEVEFDDMLIHDGRVRFRRFADDYDSGENRFIASSKFDIPLRNDLLNAEVKIDYLKGNFDSEFFEPVEINYGNFQVGVSPSYQIKEDDLTVNLGAWAYYLNDTENGESKFYVYPRITASYRLVNEILITYGGIEGGLIQNTYHEFAKTNPFVSPTLSIIPTDRQYETYVGLKGKLSNNMSYNIRGNYQAANNQSLIKANPVILGETGNYQQGNSFGVVYDDLTTFSVFGEINVDVNRNFTLGIKAEYFNYTTDEEEEAWNMPDFQASLFMDFQIDEHWFAGANLYYTGERFDQAYVFDPLNITQPETVVLESFFDANAHVGYRINDRWSVYAKANNIANQDYKRWLNYPVQGIQLLAGATYKFDF